MIRLIPFFVLSEHCIQDDQQFTHTGNRSHFFGFSDCKHIKALFTGLNRVATRAASTAHSGSSSHGDRVPVYQSNSDKRAHVLRDCPVREPLPAIPQYGTSTFNAAQALSKLFEMALVYLFNQHQFAQAF